MSTGLPMPPPLVPGDRIALVSPAGPARAALIDRAVDLVAGWGLRPELLPAARRTHPELAYLAGEDEQRAADLTAAWCDPRYAGVLCLRGGYGTIRLLDRLDVTAWRRARPKRLFGSSDITALHEFVNDRVGVASWLTPMPATAVIGDPVAMAGLSAAMFGEPAHWTLDAAGAESLRTGTAAGRLVGGNLSLVAMTRGARSNPGPATGARIAVLEDVSEPTYRLDGYLQVLRRSGWFDPVVGVATGSWLECGDPDYPGSPAEQIGALLADTLGPLEVPVATGLGFGHAAASASLPLGSWVRLTAGPDGVALAADAEATVAV